MTVKKERQDKQAASSVSISHNGVLGSLTYEVELLKTLCRTDVGSSLFVRPLVLLIKEVTLVHDCKERENKVSEECARYSINL